MQLLALRNALCISKLHCASDGLDDKRGKKRLMCARVERFSSFTNS